MTTIDGLPAHVLLVHFVVVLAPLTAVAVILCALWPAVRQRLVWPTLVLAIITLVLTPLTAGAGEWLYDQQPKPSLQLQEHAERGDTMIYVAIALLVAAAVVGGVHVREGRNAAIGRPARLAVAVFAILVGIGVIAQVYRIGDMGAQAVWGDEIAHLTPQGADQHN